MAKEKDTEKIYFIGNPDNLEYDIAKAYDVPILYLRKPLGSE